MRLQSITTSSHNAVLRSDRIAQQMMLMLSSGWAMTRWALHACLGLDCFCKPVLAAMRYRSTESDSFASTIIMLRSCCGAFWRLHFGGDKKVRLGVCVLSVGF